MITVGFAGLSHLGVVSGVALASKNIRVIGYDADASLTSDLAAGRVRFYEPGLDALIAGSRNRLRFSSSLADLGACQVIYVALDVPTDDAGTSDLTGLDCLIDDVGRASSPGAVIVVLSQVPPGFTRSRAARWRDAGIDRALYYQVETLVMGDAVPRAIAPERLIVGTPDPRQPLPSAFREVLSIFGCPILPMLYESAELTKITINVCLAASVTVANTMAELCERIGADWSEMVPALKLDRRIGSHAYLGAGLGIGGGNIGRDLATVLDMAAVAGTEAALIAAIVTDSLHRREWALRTVHGLTAGLASPTVAVWGLAYKQDTAFIKNSPGVALVSDLGAVPMRAYDPQVPPGDVARSNLVRVDRALDACEGASLLAVMTPWKEFRSADLGEIKRRLAHPVIVDPYGVFDQEACLRLGFDYYRLGSSSPAPSGSY